MGRPGEAAGTQPASYCPGALVSDPRSFPHFCDWPSTPLGPLASGGNFTLLAEKLPFPQKQRKPVAWTSWKGASYPHAGCQRAAAEALSAPPRLRGPPRGAHSFLISGPRPRAKHQPWAQPGLTAPPLPAPAGPPPRAEGERCQAHGLLRSPVGGAGLQSSNTAHL